PRDRASASANTIPSLQEPPNASRRRVPRGDREEARKGRRPVAREDRARAEAHWASSSLALEAPRLRPVARRRKGGAAAARRDRRQARRLALPLRRRRLPP